MWSQETTTYVAIISWAHYSTRITGRIQTSAWPTSHPQLSFAARLQRVAQSNYSLSHSTQDTDLQVVLCAPPVCDCLGSKTAQKTGAIILSSSVQVTLAREPCEPKEDLAAVKKDIHSREIMFKSFFNSHQQKHAHHVLLWASSSWNSLASRPLASSRRRPSPLRIIGLAAPLWGVQARHESRRHEWTCEKNEIRKVPLSTRTKNFHEAMKFLFHEFSWLWIIFHYF